MGKKANPKNKGRGLYHSEKLYNESNNILYAVIAIGKSPENPPSWAIEACKKYAELYATSHLDLAEMRIVTTKSPIHPDDLVLDEIAEIEARGKSRGQALKMALGETLDTAKGRRIARKLEAEEFQVRHPDGEVEVFSSRSLRIFAKLYRSSVLKLK